MRMSYVDDFVSYGFAALEDVVDSKKVDLLLQAVAGIHQVQLS